MVEAFSNPKKIAQTLAVILLFAFLASPLIVDEKTTILGVFSKKHTTSNIAASQQLQTSEPVDLPVIKDSATKQPTILAESAIIIDRYSYTAMFSKNANELELPASTTKLATALVARSIFKLDEQITVPSAVTANVGGSTMGLKPNDVLTVHDLLWGMLLNSGNDAAYTLAYAHPEGLDGFVVAMNQLAKDLRLPNTAFSNPAGFDTADHYTTAQDLAIITDYALKDPIISEIVKTRAKTIYSLGSPSIRYELENTNTLLGAVKGISGAKTGWTDAAQGVLTTVVTRNGHEIITVVMHSANREEDTRTLIEWAYANFEW